MAVTIAASAVRTCFGDGRETFTALLRGECGAVPLGHGDPGKLNVSVGYHCPGTDRSYRGRARRLLAECVHDVVRQVGLNSSRQRVAALVGTGLRGLTEVERFALTGDRFPPRNLHFGALIRAMLPGVIETTTISNACSAGGHVLALAQDLVELGEADAVVVCATDAMTQSMLAMIGQVAPTPTRRVRPFDQDRDGVLLGEGAAAVVVVPDTWTGPALARIAATGLSCDAHHQTAPDVGGIRRAMSDAFERGARDPAEVDLVVAHGTGTALNDPAECAALRAEVTDAGGDPLVTAVKGAVGHTSGSAALINLDVGVRCLSEGVVPPVVGLHTVLEEGKGLRFAQGAPAPLGAGLVQLNAFGFGGVNAVTLLEAS